MASACHFSFRPWLLDPGAAEVRLQCFLSGQCCSLTDLPDSSLGASMGMVNRKFPALPFCLIDPGGTQDLLGSWGSVALEWGVSGRSTMSWGACLYAMPWLHRQRLHTRASRLDGCHQRPATGARRRRRPKATRLLAPGLKKLAELRAF